MALEYSKIILSMSNMVINLAKNEAERNHKVISVLKKYDIIKLKKDFESIYAHTLVEYGMDKYPKELVRLFSLEDVMEVLKDEYYKIGSSEEEVTKKVVTILNTKKSFFLLELRRVGIEKEHLKKELSKFSEKFKELVKKAADPFEIEKYNNNIQTKSNTEQILEILKKYTQKEKTILKYLTGSLPIVAKEDFIGREQDLNKLDELLKSSEKVVLVNGIGGIGKTTLAKRYLTLNQDEYDHIAWLEVRIDEQGLQTSFLQEVANNQELHKSLTIPLDSETSEEARFNAIMHAMQNLEGKNLLLIDNATNVLQTLKDALPSPPSWHVLVTSRLELEGFKKLGLDILAPDEAKALFIKHTSEKTIDEKELELLLEYIGYHTLTIELLAKTFHKSLTLKKVSEITNYMKSKAFDHERLAKKIVIDHSKNKEITAYQHLLSAFTMADMGEVEIWLLKQFSVLPSVPMEAVFILDTLLYTKLGLKSYSKEIIADTLQAISQKGWLQKDVEGKFSMHRIIQTAIRYQTLIKSNDCGYLIDKVAQLLEIDQSKDNPIEKFPYVVFGESLLFNFKDEDDMGIFELKNNLAMVYKEMGRYPEAIELMEQLYASYKGSFGNDRYTILIQSNLGVLYKNQEKYQKAQKLLEDAFEQQKNLPISMQDGIKTTMSNLALVYIKLNRLDEAAILMEQVLTSDMNTFGENHPNTIASISNLSMIYDDMKRYIEAERLAKKALTLAKECFEEGHPNIAKSINNLALMYYRDEKNEEAEQLFEEALASDKKNFGENHPSTVRSMYNISLVYEKLGKYKEAKNYIYKSYNFYLESLGKEHAQTKSTKKWLDRIKRLA
ncbi:tetratricopeptide repeat protein [Chondrinema litorale]|uniref:tetratricopeptide repeat protein n=1 Tax=Chondrinema litorale TaxID=2994555 RepID=UPI002543DFB5|nr:tetratricopeptide repeat protein [Chondrinema litorale]UZS00220.1 tetratricopeptide repeat protein [Chondrinema litorale]